MTRNSSLIWGDLPILQQWSGGGTVMHCASLSPTNV